MLSYEQVHGAIKILYILIIVAGASAFQVHNTDGAEIIVPVPGLPDPDAEVNIFAIHEKPFIKAI